MLSVDRAQKIILEKCRTLEGETVSLTDAAFRHGAAAHRSTRALPPFDNSAMDGYALIADDIARAPVELPVVSAQIAGGPRVPPLERGQAARIMTGAPLPAGADVVVMREMTDESRVALEAPHGTVVVNDAVSAKSNVRYRGEDVAMDAVVLDEGDLVTPARLNLVASAGLTEVRVVRRPRVAIIASGDELKPLGAPLTDDDIVNSNAHAIAAAARALGAEAHLMGIAKDTLEDHLAMIESARDHDVIVTIGGVSVGTHDFVKPAMEAAGFPLDLWKVAMRPGKPLAFSARDRKLVFGLPGNPVSSLVSFRLFVRPALLTLMGARDVVEVPIPARFSGEVAKKRADLRYFSRARYHVDGHGLVVELLSKQSSGQISGLAAANALCVMPEGISEVRAGDRVGVLFG